MESDSLKPVSENLIKSMVERLRTSQIVPQNPDSDRSAPITRIPDLRDYVRCTEDTLPENIRDWAHATLRLLDDDTIGADEKRHAQHALSLMMSVQWKTSFFEPIDPHEARRILDEELYGLEEVKQRVIETIIQINRTHTLPFYGLLLVGPAGTGKSQIAYAVAKILKMPWAVLDMSTVRDPSALTGSSRIYVNARTGPSTWYRKAGINLRWWKSPRSATVDEMKRNLQSSGMVQVWSGTGQEANSKLNSSKYLRPGDIASMLSSDSAHGAMWTGEDWRSDAIQGTKPYPYSSVGRGGNQTFILWRHPALQEPGLSVQGDGLGNPMDGGMTSGFGGGSHVWPDFNVKPFPIMTDKHGQYTNEPLLLGIANHLRIEGGGGVNGLVGDTFGDVGGYIPGANPP